MLYKVFDIRGTKQQQDFTAAALAECSFPFDLCIPGMMEQHGMRYCPTIWSTTMPHNTAGELIVRSFQGKPVKGSLSIKLNAKYYGYHGLEPYYLPPYPKKLGVVPDPGMWEEDEDVFEDPPGKNWESKSNMISLMKQVIVHEAGHLVDVSYVTGPMRRRIYNAFHGELEVDIPPHGHWVHVRDPAPKNRPDLITARIDDDKIVARQTDGSGDYLERDIYQTGNAVAPRFTYLPGTPIPGVPGREQGFMRTVITDFSNVNSWLQPQPDTNAVWPVSKTASYEYRVAESFAEAFAQTYADHPPSRQFVHNPNQPGIQQVIARTLTPWMLELYRTEQMHGGGNSGQHGADVEGLPTYIPPSGTFRPSEPFQPATGHEYYWPLPAEPMPPTDPVGWSPVPSRGSLEGYYGTQKEKRFHKDHDNYAPEGAIIFESRESAVESGKVPCPQCNP